GPSPTRAGRPDAEYRTDPASLAGPRDTWWPYLPPVLGHDVGQHDPIDLPVHPDPDVVILPVHEILERLEKGRVGASLRLFEPLLGLTGGLAEENRLQLFDDLGRDRHQIVWVAGEEVAVVQELAAVT